jgi:hypothetical protein
MAQWESCWPRPVARAMPGALGRSRCHQAGRTTASAGRLRGGPSSSRWPRTPRWHGRGASALATPGGPRPGCRATVSMARLGGGGSGWQRRATPRSWRSRGKHRSGGLASTSRSKRLWLPWGRRAGSGGGQALGPQASAGRTGRGALGSRRGRPPGAAGSWSVGVSAPRRRGRPLSCWPPRRRSSLPW